VSDTAQQRMAKVLDWIEAELKAGRVPAAPQWSAEFLEIADKGPLDSRNKWQCYMSCTVDEVCVEAYTLSHDEKQFVLRGVAACGYTVKDSE